MRFRSTSLALGTFAIALLGCRGEVRPAGSLASGGGESASLVAEGKKPAKGSETLAVAPAPKVETSSVEVQVASTTSTAAACPKGMTLAEGEYCTDVVQTCLKWLDPPGRYHLFRCAEYAKPAKCVGKKIPMHYCVDVDEQKLTPSSDPRPENHVSYTEAKNACTARGAHLCSEQEWQFACEGEEMRPYPYGFVRDSDACNIDKFELGKHVGGLLDRRTKQGENAKCVSPFGARDMAGNLEEWSDGNPNKWGKKTLLKGSWWLPGRSTCRATNAGHDEVYEGTETGFRCCK